MVVENSLVKILVNDQPEEKHIIICEPIHLANKLVNLPTQRYEFMYDIAVSAQEQGLKVTFHQ